MKFLVVAVGHRMPAWVDAGFAQYAGRMPREARLELLAVKAAARGGPLQQAIETEAKRILAALPARSIRVVLDERGTLLSTMDVVRRIARWRHQASEMGRELDSLADVISFGVAPAAIALAAGLDHALDQLALMYFVGCGVSRLARYNITADDLSREAGKVTYFEGTPIPTSVVPLGLLMLAFHLGKRKDAGTLRPEQISLGKLNNVREALQICRTARTILGANGISLEYPVIRHMTNLESVLTYEGTSEMHTLILGQAMTGQSAFR